LTLIPFQNTLITWNAHPSNPNGVIVIAEFLPGRYINKTTLDRGYTKLMERTMLVTDNGSTSIPWSFFSIFPEEGHIILWIVRGNYSIVSDGKYNYQEGGYTAAAVWDVRIPISPININCSNNTTARAYKITYTNNITHTLYPINLNPNSGGTIQIPPGTYDVGFSRNTGATVSTTFSVNGQSASGYSATFHGVQILSGSGPYYERIGGPVEP
jgi:hypothetical protein